jgi:competence protein ComGC
MQGKRGGFTLSALGLVAIVMSAFLIIVIPLVAKEAASGKLAKKTVVARDLALLLDSIYAYPFDTEVTYDVNLDGLTVLIENGMVQVSVDKNIFGYLQDPSARKYYFAPVNDNPVYPPMTNPKKLIFKKIDGIVSITPII